MVVRWLESEEGKEPGDCDHSPRQSELYATRAKDIEHFRDVLGFIVYGLFMILILLSSWINLEEGKFPFNVDFMADMAYAKRKFGNPALALFVGFLTGLLMVFGRLLVIRVTESKCYEALTADLERKGKLRKIKPHKP